MSPSCIPESAMFCVSETEQHHFLRSNVLKAAFVFAAPLLGLALISSSLGDANANPFSCTQGKRKVAKYKKQHPEQHVYFAARNDKTITGMRGCGWGAHKSKSKAKSIAMKHCKKWELEYGTNGGKNVCRFIDF